LLNYIQNYEINKLSIGHPDAINLIILLALVVLIILSLRKSSTTLLDVSQTNQGKGLAILLIIIGHLWVHISNNKPALVWSGGGISLFLILSGYGLTRSQLQLSHSVGFEEFFSRRTKRVFYPYWIATAVILGMDFLLLDRTYSLHDILLTTIGVNISTTTRHIDYTRWFITFILFWYIMFFVSTKVGTKRKGLLFLFLVSIVLLPLDYYLTKLGWYQIFSFWTGCAIGQARERLTSLTVGRDWMVFAGCSAGLIVSSVYKIYFDTIFEGSFPYFLVLLIREGIGVIFSCSLLLGIIFLGKLGFISKLLSLIGIISYELFLLHGPLLIKYDFIIQNENVVLSFFLYLVVICALSAGLHRVTVALR